MHVASERLCPWSLRVEAASVVARVPRTVLGGETLSPPPPPTGLIARLGFWAWAEIRAGEEVIPATGGSMAAFYRLALERPELEIETSARRWRELSACYAFLGVELIQCQSNHDIYACS
jgi:hypothetical protein